MTLKNGYKSTEIGYIPIDWQIAELRTCLELLTDFEANGSFESVASNVSIFDAENYSWYVRATDLENNAEINNVKFVDEKSYRFLKKTKLYGGEVLITKRGEIGKVYFFQMKTDFATLAPNMYLLKLNNKVVPYFIYSYFKNQIGNRLLIEKNASSTLGALYKDDVKSILIALPPTFAEQTAIATALSDTDTLITSIEKLIEKKRAIKQGAMQELLRPKEGWEVKKLGEIADILTGFPFPSSGYSNSGIRLLRGSNIKRGNTDWNEGNCQYWPNINTELLRYQLNCGDIVVAMDGSLVGKSFAQLSQFDLPAILLQRVARIRSTFIDMNYLKEFVCSEMFTGYCDSVKTSSAIPHISPADINNYKISYPINKSEQTHIATILSDMDAEIVVLERKMAKYKLIKQGMMQELLTGRVRLVKE